MPCEEASMARSEMPSSASRARVSCSVTGSGVVSEPYCAPRLVTMPTVPRLAESRPRRDRICRTKSATELLPLVPVTATTVSGWRPDRRAAASASARRASATSIQAVASGRSAGRVPSPATATAPAAAAAAAKSRPSAAVPGTATNTPPGTTLRLSAVSPATGRPAMVASASGNRAPRVRSSGVGWLIGKTILGSVQGGQADGVQAAVTARPPWSHGRRRASPSAGTASPADRSAVPARGSARPAR